MKNILTSLFFFIICSVSYSQPYLNLPLDTIVSNNYFNYRSLVKYDNLGFTHIVNTSQYDTQSNTREIYYRTNKSGIYVTTKVTQNSVDDNYATIDFDKNNNVHLCWERRDASNNFQVIYTNNRNVTSGFGDSIWITTGGQNKATPFMCVGKNDSLVHFVYYTFVNSVQDYAYYRNYNYITGVLSQEYQLGTGEAGSENDIECVSDTNGVVHIFYTTNININGGALKYYKFQNGTISEIQTGLSANVEYPELTFDKSTNTVHCIYRFASDKRVYLISSNSGALTTPVAITPPSIGNPSYWRAIDMDDNGKLYFTFQNSVSSGQKGFFLVYGTPGGTYTSPILIWQDSVNYIGKGSSSVAAKGNGMITVAFDPTVIRNSLVCSDILIKHGTVTSVQNNENIISNNYNLLNNYPNPFNNSTIITYNINQSSNVKLALYDIQGKLISILVNEYKEKGTHRYLFDAKSLSSGIYFYKLELPTGANTKSMLFIK